MPIIYVLSPRDLAGCGCVILVLFVIMLPGILYENWKRQRELEAQRSPEARYERLRQSPQRFCSDSIAAMRKRRGVRVTRLVQHPGTDTWYLEYQGREHVVTRFESLSPEANASGFFGCRVEILQHGSVINHPEALARFYAIARKAPSTKVRP